MNWEIIIQHSAITKDTQIHSENILKSTDCHKSHEARGWEGEQQERQKASGMILGEHPGGGNVDGILGTSSCVSCQRPNMKQSLTNLCSILRAWYTESYSLLSL
jgi:hypothetical protein